MAETGKKYDILLIGDYSNLHSQLGRSLRGLGHRVTVMSAGSGFQQTDRDIDLTRHGAGLIGGARLAWRCLTTLRRAMAGHDIVAIQNPNFLQLRPGRIRYFFDRLRGENGRVFLTAAGTDVTYLREALRTDSPLRYTEWRVGAGPSPLAQARPEVLSQWLTPEMQAHNDYVYDRVDGIVTALYEYDVAVRRHFGDSSAAGKVTYGGIPVDCHALTPVPPGADPCQCVRLFLGRHSARQVEKGTDILEAAARTVCARHPGRASLTLVEDRPYAEYVDAMVGSHVVLDQIYGYSPATNALIAMARGLNVLSGGEADYYDFVGAGPEASARPVINTAPTLESVTEALEDVVTHPQAIADRGAAGRRFVMAHNEATDVARRYLSAWTTEISN